MLLAETDRVKAWSKASGHNWKYNLKHIELLNVTFDVERTKEYIRIYENEGKNYLDVRAYDVHYKVERREEIGQDNGEHNWGYCLVRESEESGWMISNYGSDA